MGTVLTEKEPPSMLQWEYQRDRLCKGARGRLAVCKFDVFRTPAAHMKGRRGDKQEAPKEP